MRLQGRFLSRLIILSVLLLLTGTTSSTPGEKIAPAAPVAANPADAQALYRPEVRLRKLHLVRPDLILYPIAYEVYC